MSVISLRKATLQDAAIIRRLVRSANLNPTGLDWRRFILAEDSDSTVIGCVQRKPHRDGSTELASLVVAQEWRGIGVARALIEAVVDEHTGPLFLMCRADLGVFYQRFGFEGLKIESMPKYFQRISRLAGGFQKITGRREGLLVMRRDC
jgi:N-acetylglutamate synthase-like GNAT family acetyltransferase